MGLLGGSTTTKTEVDLNPQQKALVNMATPLAANYAKTPTKLPVNTPLVAGFTPDQTAGQSMALGAAGSQQDLANEGSSATNFLLNNVLYPGSNPAEQASIDAAVRPINESLTQTQLPAVRSGAAASGQYGSSRQGIAEGLATQSADRQIGDTAAGIANTDYNAGLDAMTKALGLLPSTQQAQLQPALTTSGVGEVQQQQQQQQDDANLALKLYNQNANLVKAQNLTALATGTPGGGTSSSASGSTGLLQGLTGGASLGAAITGGSPVGAAGGAGLGALLSLLS